MTPTTVTQAVPSRRRLALTTLAALGLAALVLVFFVLPAEYGIDPLGIGKALGLTAISHSAPEAVPAPAEATRLKPVQQGPIAYYSGSYKTDSRQFTLGPYQYVEYKYRLEKGASMVYSWTASAAVVHDFHGEADGAPKGQAESFDKKSRSEGHGVFTAPFSGIDGWYWENPGGDPVTVTVTTAGFYSSAIEFRMNRTKRVHEVTEVKPLPSGVAH